MVRIEEMPYALLEAGASQISPQLPVVNEQNTFSRANVFGLYLTIAFCVLIQPYGSLLYMKPGSIIGRVIFFFWRLNPLACLLEAILLAIAFIDGIWRVSTQPRSPSATSANNMRSWSQLRTVATAIQLLRIHGKTPDHWRAILGNPQPSRMTYAELNNQPASTRRVIETAIVRDAQNPPDLESGGIASTQTELSGPVRSSSSMRHDIGRIVLGRPEFILDLVGIVAAIVAIVKLATVTIPIHIRLPGIFMIVDWAFVQTLRLVSTRRDADIVDMEHTIRHATRLEKMLKHFSIWTILSLLLHPLLGYLTFLLLFRTQRLPEAMQMTYVYICFSFFALCDPLVFHFIPRMFATKPTTQNSPRRRTPLRHSLAWTAFQITKFLLCLCFGYYLGFSIGMCLVLGKPTGRYIVLPFLVIPLMMWTWIFLPGIPFMRKKGKGYEWIRGVALVFNLLTTCFFFMGTMMMYDTKGTTKPEWLDWLGKI